MKNVIAQGCLEIAQDVIEFAQGCLEIAQDVIEIAQAYIKIAVFQLCTSSTHSFLFL
ncbi:hypothetical protein [Alkalihalobacillus sp. TS-13]|uniref:hypothetical protein n=1 Tax=Alkalihalobacillus sp. TS-13 TaxID=2842455 RepID=UPI001C870F72|nr:hypothetical protein [Alkalihalobacillus sp. TS-13]